MAPNGLPIRQNRGVRRGLAGLFFFIAAIALALAGAGWLMHRVAFDTSQSADTAAEVLKDETIRNQIATVIADAAAPTLGLAPADLRLQVENVLANPAGARLMAQVIADSHARLIGARETPVKITGAQMVQAVRDERVAAVPEITLPVEQVSILNTIRVGLGWFVPVAAIGGAAFLLLGIITHPRRSDAIFGIGVFCLVGAFATIGLAYVVPKFLVPKLSDATWVPAIPAVADHSLPLLTVIAGALLVVGALLMMGSAYVRRRRDWSSPISIHRYGDQHRWS